MHQVVRTVPRQLRRTLFTSTIRKTSWSPQPSPPRLPKEEQDIFEQLQRESTGAFSTPRQRPQVNQSPHSQEEPVSNAEQVPQGESTLKSSLEARVKDGEELHPNIRRGATPEFEGDVNPKTGEVGGPKNDPIRWGSSENRGDWSYNGRVTDF